MRNQIALQIILPENHSVDDKPLTITAFIAPVMGKKKPIAMDEAFAAEINEALRPLTLLLESYYQIGEEVAVGPENTEGNQ